MSFIFLWGRPGSGKSTLAASMTRLGYTVQFLDLDQKVKKMINLRDMMNQDMIKVHEIKAKLVEGSMKQRATLVPDGKSFKPASIGKQPRGYIEAAEWIDDLEVLKSNDEDFPADILVIDSLSSLLEHLKRLIMFSTRSAKFGFDEWAIWLTNIEEFFYKLMYLLEGEETEDEEGEGHIKGFKHIIVIAHEQNEYERIGDEQRLIQVLPMIEGSMRQKAGKYFEESYHTFTRTKGEHTSFWVQTKPDRLYDCRTSRALDMYEPSDFEWLFRDEIDDPARLKKLTTKFESLKKLKGKASEED